MSDSEDISSNPSNNRPFKDVLEKNLERRKVLKGGMQIAATSFFASANISQARNWHWNWNYKRNKLINFTPVSVEEGTGPVPKISPEYDFDIILPWGDPLEPSGPDYNWPPTAADQAKQIGIGHDGMWFFPMHQHDAPRFGWDNNFGNNPWKNRSFSYGPGNTHGVLCINFEFGGNSTVIGKSTPTSLEDVRASQHAHGVGVIEIQKQGRWNGWSTVESKLARRIHVNTPVAFSGPVAGHDLLQTPNGNIPLGTVNNCSSGYTPWGTYLTCEENFNGYFGANNAWIPTASQSRYGFSTNGFGYGWHYFDKRFDLSDPDYQNEENRFGWVVEIDPMDPTAIPVKRTALGRFKHEGATVHVDDYGRVIVYSGDDQRFDYIYKFVSEENWRYMKARGQSPLDHGTLYVAKFDDNGTGQWLELSMDIPAIAAEFSDMGEMLINTRLAADIVGATPMDRPEWITVAPDDQVYCTLTNNSRRTADDTDGPNPMGPNPDGHIIRWTETAGFSGTNFDWNIFLIAEDTHGDDNEDTFSDPDGIWADPDGRLFIQTDGGQKKGLNNQMLVADSDSGELNRLLTGVTGCEITGLTTTPDRRTMFINVQHPGNGDPTATNFPALNDIPDGSTIPRDATIVITKKDGGIIGS